MEKIVEKIVVEMTWEAFDKFTPAQRLQLYKTIDTFMNNIAEKFAWNEEAFSIKNKTEKEG